MKRFLKYCLLLLLSIPLLFLSFIKVDDPLQQLLNKLEHFQDQYSVEKVHLHIDRQYYQPGDTVWFKSYTINGEDHKLSKRSRVLYVELIDELDSIRNTTILPINAGLGWGDIILGDSLQSGRYHLRAYTNWMRNYGEEYYEDQILILGSTTKKNIPNTVQSPLAQSADIQIFPEGGWLVNGISSVIGFKITGINGQGISASGTIIDQRGHKVAELTTEHNGMGAFKLKPQAGISYTGLLHFVDGSEKKLILPLAKTTGYVLSADNTQPDSLRVSITYSADIPADQEVILLAQSNGVVNYVSKSKGIIKNATIPKGRFTTGLLHLTLFSASMEPLAERLVFISHDDQLHLTVDKIIDKENGKVRLTMTALDANKQPAQGSFSLSVTDAGNTNEADGKTILADLLLCADLKGYIENPGYYFNGTMDAEKIRQLDNLLLTQGWSRFTWKEIAAGHNAPQYSAETGLTISGNVSWKGKGVAAGRVTMYPMGNMSSLLDTVTDNKGRFRFDNLVFAAGTKFVIRAQTKDGDQAVDIVIDKQPQRLKVQHVNASYDNPSAQYLAYQMKKPEQNVKGKGIQLKQINVKERSLLQKTATQQFLDKYSRNLAGKADKVITSEQLEKYNNIATAILANVAGIRVNADARKVVSWAGGAPSLRAKPPGMLVVLDGSILGNDVDLGVASDIPVDDVETVEVLKSATNIGIYGSRGSNGVLVITTKHGGESTAKPSRKLTGIINYSPKGYYLANEFYTPVYSPASISRTDTRPTIYWNPKIVTDSAGKATVEFSCFETKKRYNVIIEGIDVAGKLGRTIINIQ